jgi:hypothetical protein
MPDSLRMCMAANPSRVSCMDGDVGGLVGGKVGTHPNGIPRMIPMVFTVCKPSFGQDRARSGKMASMPCAGDGPSV